MLIDLTRCIGCRACQAACKQWNGLAAERTRNRGGYENPADLSARTWTRITSHELTDDGGLRWVFAKRQCMHCLEPACVSACQPNALRKTTEGPVDYDHTKCTGCGDCALACPFGMPRFESRAPVARLGRCRMCADRIAARRQPVCSQACATEALVFGERAELLEDARARCRARPGRYVGRLYGEKEAGGTSMIYLSGVPFEKLGFPDLDSKSSARRRMIAAPSAISPAVALVSAATAGLSWIIERRDRGMIRREEARRREQE